MSCFTFFALGATLDCGVKAGSTSYAAILTPLLSVVFDFEASFTEHSDFFVSDADGPPRAQNRFFCTSGTFVVDWTWHFLVEGARVAIAASIYCDR